MKKIIIVCLLASLSFKCFAAWVTYNTDAGGIGIYQNMATGKSDNQISIYEEDGGYSFLFITNEIVSSYDWFGNYEADFSLVNDKNETYDYSASQVAQNAFRVKKMKGLLKFLQGSKWIKMEFFVNRNGSTKTIKFNIEGIDKAIKKVKE